jgi:hypothetical protein
VRYETRPLGNWTDPETPVRRGAHIFKASWRDTLVLLGDEIERIGGKEPVVLQIDVQESDIRFDGMLRANARVGHPGVVISFESQYGPLRYATDAHEKQYSYGMEGWQANIRAIALSLVALRAVDRYGVTKRGEQYTGWRAITAGGPTFATASEAANWMRKYAGDQLNLDLDKSTSLGALYRAMAKRMHPDSGGPRADWDRLDEARRMLAEAGML